MPLTISHLIRLGRDRLISLDEGDEFWPGIYIRVDQPINRATPIPAMQAGFDHHFTWTDALFKSDILNTGGGWMELGYPSFPPAAGQHTRAFLWDWWALGQKWRSGKYMKDTFSFEQRILSVLMGLHREIRRRTAILEDQTYNSPRSSCIRHLYAVPNKQNPEYLYQMAQTLRRAVEPFLGLMTMTVVPAYMGQTLEAAGVWTPSAWNPLWILSLRNYMTAHRIALQVPSPIVDAAYCNAWSIVFCMHIFTHGVLLCILEFIAWCSNSQTSKLRCWWRL